MSGEEKRSIGEVLRSPRFHKEVSMLLFFFAAVNALISVFLLASGDSNRTF